MPDYLQGFYGRLREKHRGSLVSVNAVEKIERNAKEYLNKLAKAGSIERVTWGWYWVPVSITDIWQFFRRDKNFKVVASQTAASVWNGNFVHRDVYTLKVLDRSYGRALQEFGSKRGWKIEVEYVQPGEVKYNELGGLLVEDIEENIIECVRRWAFADAFATLYVNRRKIEPASLARRTCWQRVAGSNVRVKQVLQYAYNFANQLEGKRVFPQKKVRLKDDFVKRDVEEAVEKVVELV